MVHLKGNMLPVQVLMVEISPMVNLLVHFVTFLQDTKEEPVDSTVELAVI